MSGFLGIFKSKNRGSELFELLQRASSGSSGTINAAQEALGQESDVSAYRNERGETLLHTVCRLPVKGALLTFLLSKGGGTCLGIPDNQDHETPMHLIFKRRDWPTLAVVADFVNNHCLSVLDCGKRTPLDLIKDDADAIESLSKAFVLKDECQQLVQWVRTMINDPAFVLEKDNQTLQHDIDALKIKYKQLTHEKTTLLQNTKRAQTDVNKVRHRRPGDSGRVVSLRSSQPTQLTESLDGSESAGHDPSLHDESDDLAERVFECIDEDKKQELERYLKHFNNPNVRENPDMCSRGNRDFLNRTALHHAIESEKGWAARLLIAYSAAVDAKDNKEMTPADYCRLLKINDPDLAKYFLCPTRYLVLRDELKNGHGDTALKYLEVHRGDLDAVYKSPEKNTGEYSLLHLAILAKLHRVTRALIRRKANVNLATRSGATPLDLVLAFPDQKEDSVKKMRRQLQKQDAKKGSGARPLSTSRLRETENLRGSGTYSKRPGASSTREKAPKLDLGTVLRASGDNSDHRAAWKEFSRFSTSFTTPRLEDEEGTEPRPASPTVGLLKSKSARSYSNLIEQAEIEAAEASTSPLRTDAHSPQPSRAPKAEVDGSIPPAGPPQQKKHPSQRRRNRTDTSPLGIKTVSSGGNTPTNPLVSSAVRPRAPIGRTSSTPLVRGHGTGSSSMQRQAQKKSRLVPIPDDAPPPTDPPSRGLKAAQRVPIKPTEKATSSTDKVDE